MAVVTEAVVRIRSIKQSRGELDLCAVGHESSWQPLDKYGMVV